MRPLHLESRHTIRTIPAQRMMNLSARFPLETASTLSLKGGARGGTRTPTGLPTRSLILKLAPVDQFLRANGPEKSRFLSKLR